MENNKKFAAKAFMEANITLIITFAYFHFCGINRILAWNNSIRDYVHRCPDTHCDADDIKAETFYPYMELCRFDISLNDEHLSLCDRSFYGRMEC